MLRTVATTFFLIMAVFVAVSLTTNGAPFSSPANIKHPQPIASQTVSSLN